MSSKRQTRDLALSYSIKKTVIRWHQASQKDPEVAKYI